MISRAAAVASELRDDGFHVAIDDVGVGHSGLSRLMGLVPTRSRSTSSTSAPTFASTTTIVEMLVALV
jgi:EAL domain-containing protein (putative c-di-GMP-specific phosphodiesterase class I)